jgi:LmbE family N-acetylglucosaminyl deacetylase
MGGTLARYSAEGVRTIVATCTRGDLGEVRNQRIRDVDVGALRERELEAATQCLGVSRLVQLGYSDSGMAGWPENHRPGAFFAADPAEAAAKLVDVIEQERPQVMVAYDETGGYGHPDHLKANQIAVEAYAKSGASQPAKLYFVRLPLTWTRDFAHSLSAAGIDAPASAATGANASPDTLEVGVPDHLVTTIIDVRQYVGAKRAALACHATQMPPTHFLMRMPSVLANRLWACEYYSRHSGPTTAPPGERETDLFSGLS